VEENCEIHAAAFAVPSGIQNQSEYDSKEKTSGSVIKTPMIQAIQIN
jgi:hypothetical protein